MSTKVDPPTTATTAAASSPKISMFAAKSGFVIPKNKLSGSLVPIFRGNKKPGGSDAASEENAKQVHRKTKWGPDLTQDPAVRKGRALAYQTRVDQITQQLKLGSLEIEHDQDSPMESHMSDHESSRVQINSEESGLLELERREAIGEILKLNPSYKAPADYKPLLKEAKVPIPIKEYPGYNFIGLIFGSASDTQKRLEKETGAKIRVYGAKEDMGEKNEITPSDGNETLSVYKELYVHVCADTYEKVDAAVALIELLVTPVSVNPVSASTTSTVASGDSANVIRPSQGTPTNYMPPPALNQGLAQPILGPPPHGQFQPYPNPWFPVGPPSGFTTNQNPSPPILSNPPVQVSSSPSNASNMPSLFGPRPLMSGPQNPSFVGSRPQPILQGQRPYMPQPPLGFMGPPRTSMPGQPNVSAPPPFSGTQPLTTGAPQHNMRPLAAPLPQSGPPLTFLNRPMTSAAGWSQAPAGHPVSLGPSNTGQMQRPMVPPSQGPHPMSGGPPLNMVNSPFRPPAPQSSGAPPNRPIAAPIYNSMPTRPHSSMSPMQPMVARPNTPFGSTQILSPVASAPPPPPQSGNPSYALESAPSFTPVKPPSVSAPVPLQPSSNNFTFQPHRPQNPVSPVMPRPPPQNFPGQQPPTATQTPSFRPAMHNSGPPQAMQGIPSPNFSNPTGQPQSQISTSFPPGPPRHSAFQNPGPIPPTTLVPQMGPRNFGPSPFPPRPVNHAPLQQSYPAMGNRPPSFVAPNQLQFGGNRPASGPLGTQQIYDPFSPTSVPQVGGPAKVGKQESDPEYEDLMASVGVK